MQNLVRVQSSGRLTGTVKAASLVAEQGATLVVDARIGTRDIAAVPERVALGMGEPPAKPG